MSSCGKGLQNAAAGREVSWNEGMEPYACRLPDSDQAKVETGLKRNRLTMVLKSGAIALAGVLVKPARSL